MSVLKKKRGAFPPLGYKLYDKDPGYWIEEPEIMEALRQSKAFLNKGHALRPVLTWFHKVTGRKCAFEAFRKAMIRIEGDPKGFYLKEGPPEPPKKVFARTVTLEKLEERQPRREHSKIRVKRALKREQKMAEEEVKTARGKYEAAKNKARKKKEALAVATKSLVEEKAPAILTHEQFSELPRTAQEELVDRPIIFEPNPGPQTDFLAASEREVFYGGARGGGKSYSLIVDPLRYCHREAHRALILRRTMPELRDLINHTQRLYPKAFPGAKWREQEKEWRFPSGARVEFGYAENETDALRYQGQAYSWIGIDELPQYPDGKIWNDLRGSLRTADPDLPCFMRATGNPGNVGSAWVKEMFIDPAPANTRFEVPIALPDGRTSKISRRYIPAKVTDNPYLTRTDAYLTMLASLPEIQRRQWLDGDWDAWDGAAFPEFRTHIHVVEPFQIPHNWIRFRAADWGFSSPFCVLWFAVDYDENLWVYREFYGKGLTADVFADRVRGLEMGERVQYGVMDASVWQRRGDVGPGIIEEMRKRGCIWRPSDRSVNSRRNGKMEVHRRLRVDDITDQPKIKIFNTCRNIIKDLPTLPLDENDPEDVDTKANDHSYDALRYGCMSRPISPARIDWLQQMAEAERYQPSSKVFGY